MLLTFALLLWLLAELATAFGNVSRVLNELLDAAVQVQIRI
jgi:hypothetical protein